MIKVFIDGSAGTTGLSLEERLSGLDYVNLIDSGGPSRKDPAARKTRLNEADVAFLCLPDEAAKEAVSMIENSATVAIDASTAHRTADGWAYGFPELSAAHKKMIRNSNRIAVPGCHASGFAAIVYPAVQGGFIDPNSQVYCHSLTGYSGGGKSMIAEYEAEGEKKSAAKLYSLGTRHKHLPEMKHVCGLNAAPVFVPILVKARQGMIVSVPILNVNALAVWEYFKNHYAGADSVSVMPFSTPDSLELEGTNGSGGMEIYVHGDETHAAVQARFDNLGKGSCGAAVQCMKVRMGYE
ncbi:MAG: N-acetyl-gamma-glutamyl-phosphate reductase [Defluviitaleaceae bacterium]|nr:N-acetyl-gamma-glutamyl-phosphate reductase [Defluviitaleaceae bacterium]